MASNDATQEVIYQRQPVSLTSTRYNEDDTEGVVFPQQRLHQEQSVGKERKTNRNRRSNGIIVASTIRLFSDNVVQCYCICNPNSMNRFLIAENHLVHYVHSFDHIQRSSLSTIKY